MAKRDKGKKSQEGEDEPAKRDAEKAQIIKVAGEQNGIEEGSNPTGIYELCGGFGAKLRGAGLTSSNGDAQRCFS